ncbi:MAG: 3-deoxy-8-phosphooctulonate synthase [Candidatus Dadabacteria bacterium]|nr:MAG: 3-deoxy-8-phosphooctulonate synthase [Candidatus Dadabacteria bacterium]
MQTLESIFPHLYSNVKHKCLIIAGPCQIESLDICLKTASFLKDLTKEHSFPFIFKASFDKANRTSLKSPRGVGLKEGLEVLREVKESFNIPVLTDIHEPWQAEEAAKVVDVIQIPAFLCRQTDLLIAAGKTIKPVHIKKGQFIHPLDMQFAVEKVTSQGNSKVIVCERGACFGYRDLVVDFRSICLLKKLGLPVVFDATHSVQKMGGETGVSSGEREFAVPLSRAALAVGADGIFFECHPKPEEALSDKELMLDFNQADNLLSSIKELL